MTQFPRKIVAIHAHPDDAEIFAAGTLALMQARGYALAIVTMTPGGLGGVGSDERATAALRRREAGQAAAILGASYHCAEARDGYVFDSEALRIRITEILRSEQAGIVITHLPDDYHADHRATCQIVEAAALVSTLPNAPCAAPPLAATPLLYHSAPLGGRDRIDGAPVAPHFYVDVSAVFDVKMRMLACHRSQVELMRVMHGMDDFMEQMRAESRELGRRAGCAYAEAFWQHRGAGFPQHKLLQRVLAQQVRTGATARAPAAADA